MWGISKFQDCGSKSCGSLFSSRICHFLDFDVDDALGTQIATFRPHKRSLSKVFETGIASVYPIYNEQIVLKILALNCYYLSYTKGIKGNQKNPLLKVVEHIQLRRHIQLVPEAPNVGMIRRQMSVPSCKFRSPWFSINRL